MHRLGRAATSRIQHRLVAPLDRHSESASQKDKDCASVLGADKTETFLRAGMVQPGKEKTPRTPYSSHPVPEGGLEEY